MQTTMNLLAAAIEKRSIPEWTRELGLSAKALYTAKDRAHLSPAVAGALAEKLGQNVDQWIVIAALESERESACKTRMLKRIAKITSLYLRKLLSRQRPRRSKR